ncbi:hypothetical protein CA13_08140 [Planctomycetes bacterium CA13]|uniref:DUF2721 domain-containing protein n=1 Tax=Novipirellula herctigrandis TaxID=2527986 RepID=A0A5C5YWJ5_9BACT|nr:hypothetical protein CA13_08140 [Planctomycetes bacterium CA13]
MTLTELVPILQLSIGPVILVSGVGLILLSMTNRIGRVIDRSRQLVKTLRVDPDADRDIVLDQLRIFSRRAKIIRAGVAFGVFSVLLAALLVIGLFVGAYFHFDFVGLIAGDFILCMVCLIACLVLFLVDINLSLTALWHEIPPEGQQGD